MKKIVLTLFVAAAFFSAVKAQVSGGVKGALNFATTVSPENDFDTDTKIAPAAGGFIEFGLVDKLSFQPELLLSFQGSRTKSGGTTSKLNLTYINIPLIFKYEIVGGLHAELGPQLGFLIAAHSKVKNDGYEEKRDVKDNLEGTDLGLNIGLGYEVQNLIFDLRYYWGWSKIYETGRNNEPVRNSLWQLGVGYRLF
ncbi:porin family protein [Fulvivirga sediminis]|uniref:PorT family protein n=1 Tax=Fulvivirga sediminis TaxID=2803949 RepID=A0A937F7L5_9BACT|nr:porin family protein [Fulvivirga sediminis]MBL3656099.1 PorT family protein [Fulvivirga sediminis]